MLSRAKLQFIEQDRDGAQREIAILESKVATMQNERDVLTKLRAQAEGSTHEKVSPVAASKHPDSSSPGLQPLPLGSGFRV